MIIGRRRDLKEWSWTDETRPQNYDYGKYPNGNWYCVVPEGRMGNLGSHEITEHNDGAITVSPSILIGEPDGVHWHGYLVCGMWREV